MLDNSEIARWLNWCSHVDRLLLLDREGLLDLVAGHPNADAVLFGIEREAVEGERLALLLQPHDAAAAATRIVLRLDGIAVALSQRLVEVRGAGELGPPVGGGDDSAGELGPPVGGGDDSRRTGLG